MSFWNLFFYCQTNVIIINTIITRRYFYGDSVIYLQSFFSFSFTGCVCVLVALSNYLQSRNYLKKKTINLTLKIWEQTQYQGHTVVKRDHCKLTVGTLLPFEEIPPQYQYPRFLKQYHFSINTPDFWSYTLLRYQWLCSHVSKTSIHFKEILIQKSNDATIPLCKIFFEPMSQQGILNWNHLLISAFWKVASSLSSTFQSIQVIAS